MRPFVLLLVSTLSLAHPSLAQRAPGNPLDHLPPNIEILTHFGERADISPDNQRVAFMTKSFGDAMVIDLKSRIIQCLTCNVPGAAFLQMGDQFIALFERGARAEEPHFGLVVDDREAARRALEEAGIEILPGPFFDVRDPSGNRVQIVQYDQIQFTKTDRVLAGMDLELGKSESALEELRAKDLAD